MKNIIIIVTAIIMFLLIISWPFINTKTQKTSQKQENIIVVSNFALYDVMTTLVQGMGSSVQVKNLMPFGSDVHTFEPTPKDMVHLQKSKLFVYSGVDLEPWSRHFERYDNTFNIAPFLKLIKSKHEHHHDEEKSEEKHHHDVKSNDHAHEYDPHYWLNIANMITITKRLSEELAVHFPHDTKIIMHNQNNYIQKLEALHDDIKTNLGTCELHSIVSNHNAFAYLAEAYHFDVHSVMGVSVESQSSAYVMQELVEFIKKEKIETLFYESFVSNVLIQTVAKESGISNVEILFPLANVEQSQVAEGYVNLMRQNVMKLSKALRCKGK